MKRSKFSRALSLMLALVMVLSMLPASVFATDSATWTRVDAADITADDTIMVTMTNPNGVTYALYTVQSGSKGNDALVVTVDGDTVTTEGTADYGWTVTPVEGGYTLSAADGYLYTINDNNGVRIGDTAAVWAIDGTYLSTTDTGGNTRWLGVYDNNGGDYTAVATPNWRAYKNTTGNTKGQTLDFWKLSGSSETTDPTDPVEPVELPNYVLTNTIAAGDVVLVYNANSGTVLTSTASGYKLAGQSVTAESGVIAVDAPVAEWTVGINDDGSYTFTQGEMVLGMVQSGSFVNLSTNAADGCTAWTLENGTADATFYLKNTNMPEGSYGPYYLEYYSGYTAYGSSSPSDSAFGMQFYVQGGSTVNPDPTDPDPVEPEDPVVPEGTVATLVTDLASLELGDEIILVAPNNSVAMSVNNGNYFNPADVTMGDGVVYFGDDVQTLLLESGLTDGTYALNASGYYLCAVSGSSNHLKQEASVTAYSSWTIEIAGDGIATIKSTGDAERNWIRYNASSPRFSCYKSGQNDIAIYKVERDQYAELTNELSDGDEFVIYYPKESTVISTTASGSKLTGVAATPENDFLLVEDGMAVLTADLDENGYYTLTNAEGKYLTCGATGNSLTFEDAASDYSLWLPEQTEGGWFIKSVNAAYSGYSQYIEVYNSLFTTFSLKETSDTSYYTMQFYALTDKQPSVGGKPAAGDQVVIYNLSAQGVLGAENDTQSIENVTGYVEENTFVADNGAVIFTVETDGTYHRFYNETYGYLCSNGTGNNAFYSLEASEDADWILLTGKSGGWNMESRTAKYNGTYSQYLEYYADSYKTYSMYNVTDYDIYEFLFYPLNTDFTWGTVTGGIVNYPQLIFDYSEPMKGQDWVLTFYVDTVFGLKEGFDIKIFADPTGDGSEQVELTDAYTLAGPDATGNYTITVPASVIDSCGAGIVLDITAEDITDYMFGNIIAYEIADEPSITDVSPAANAQTLDDKRPIITAVIVNAGEDAVVTMTVNGEDVEAVYDDGVVSWTPAEDLADGRTSVTVTVTRADGKTTTKTWSFTVGEAKFELYFGQLHSHTTYSDGSGSLETALEYIASLPESANVDFVAFTDHSNYFDTSSSANPEQALYDMSLASEYSQELWSAYKGAIADFNASRSDVIAIGGFEMTWSGGPGHINTFATEGIVSRNNTTLNNKTSDAGMKAYYALLSQTEGADSVSQFNHPGTTFGNFSDFAYWDAVVDSRIYLVEVGNGEGAIGAGGYYPSYEQYTMALDKGWHVAPTNNQDNHKGKWGNANDARDVVLTDDFSEEGVYEAIRNYRVYATEDKNLEIGYTVNGLYLGSTIEEVPETLNVEVTVYDPDSSDSISKVEVIVNSGKVAYTWDDPTELAQGLLTAELSPDYSYYYIRVTQGDGDLAVTAPVWVGETLKLGISAVETSTSTPVTDEELTISTTLFNSETTDALITNLVYTVGDQVIGVDSTGYTIPASGNTTVTFAYTPEMAKVMTVTVTAYVTLDGVEYIFSMDLELDVQDASKLVYIGIDASHYNEYVNGNYKDSMGNFGNLAAQYNVRTVILYSSEELIAACENEKYVAMILTAPSRRNGNALRDPYATYSDEEIAALVEFNARGGALILTGWGDYYESYSDFTAEDHMAAQQNKILEAVGSSLRISDDETKDDTWNGGQSQRLYLSVYDFDNFLLEGVDYDAENSHDNMYTELYSHYGASSIYAVDENGEPTNVIPETVTPTVYGFDTTKSIDDDGDNYGGLGAIPTYTVGESQHLMVMATEQLEGQGLIVVAGGAFMSNFEVQATTEDSGAEKNYSNYKICENLLAYLNPVEITPIAEVQAQTESGIKYTIEGVVTSNASGYDKNTAFFDCIYVQDTTGGVCCFPVAGNYKIGDLVRITGTTDFYQGEMELQVSSIEVIGEGTVEPTAITAAQLNDGSVLGSLVTLSGTVESFEYANGLVQTIYVKDSDGNVGRVFIDGYITTGYDVENLAVGSEISVTGLASYDNTFDGPAPRIRVRDRHDVVCTDAFQMLFEDVKDGDWFYDAVEWAAKNGITTGVTETLFAPYGTAERCQVVTMLWRMAGCPEANVDNPFVDVKETDYFYQAVLWAVEQGITNGTTSITFSPYAATERCQVVTMLWRMEGKPEAAVSNPFTDVAVDAYYCEAVLWAYGNGVATGTTDTTFAPSALCERAAIVAFLYRYAALN